jgi:hypothetical protein
LPEATKIAAMAIPSKMDTIATSPTPRASAAFRRPRREEAAISARIESGPEATVDRRSLAVRQTERD